MDIEDRIRSALKQNAQSIHVSSNVRKRVIEQLEKQNGRRKWFVRVAVTGIMLLVVNSMVSAVMGESLFNVAVHWTTVSRGDGFMTGYSLKPLTSSAESSQKNKQSQSKMNVEKPVQSTPITKTPTGAVRITGPTVSDTSFEDIHGYGKDLSDFLGTDQFPKLNMNNVQVDYILATWINKDNQEFDLEARGNILGMKKESIRLMLYHNQEGTINFGGGTTSKDKKDIKVNDQNATYISFTNGDSVQRYITWNQGSWIIVLSGSDLPEARLLEIAQNVDLQAKTNTLK